MNVSETKESANAFDGAIDRQHSTNSSTQATAPHLRILGSQLFTTVLPRNCSALDGAGYSSGGLEGHGALSEAQN
jgi:hypothetical protein